VCGAVAGATSRTVTAPLDRLRVLLQTNTTSSPMTVRQGIQHIYQKGGLAGYYVGNGMNVLKHFPEAGVRFLTFERFKSVAADLQGVKESDLGPVSRFLAGGCAGVLTTVVAYPFEVVKTRIQVSSDAKTSALKLTRDMWVREGGLSLYRGLLPSVMGIFPYAGFDFAMYETLKKGILERGLIDSDSKYAPLVHMGCGIVSASIGTTLVYPLHVVRTRLQAQSTVANGSEELYKGMRDVFKRTYAREGVRGFYKGVLPNLCRVAPAASVSYCVYEQMKKLLNVE
ncbi:hypothetical protein SELMODRAFT_33390, partial [Selaginella moellendorffii]